MNRLFRLGFAVLILGLTLMLVTAARNSTSLGPISYESNGEASKNGWSLYPAELWAPRQLTVDIEANNSVDVYVLTMAAAKQWNTDGVLQPTFAFKNITLETETVQVNVRGAYAILTYVPTNDTAVKVTVTLDGYEEDLLYAAVAISTAGVIIAVSAVVIQRMNKKPRT